MNRLINLNNMNFNILELFFNTIVAIIIIIFIKIISKKVVSKIENEKIAYTIYSIIRITLHVLLSISILVIWSDYVKNIITLISFLSAAVTVAIRDIILNWFCGLYIKIHRPFKLEDRIEIDNIKGDVIDLSALSFDILEVSNKDEFGQSTGIIINFPNSYVFSHPVKNLTKNFKYVWCEMNIEIGLKSDLEKAKKTLYKIINDIDIIKSIPKKMKNQINDINKSYRIYYNNYEPIIYSKIEGPKIVLSLRYLVHPKKSRYVMSIITNKIYEANKNGDIELFN